MTTSVSPVLLPFRAPVPAAPTQGALALALLPRQGPPPRARRARAAAPRRITPDRAPHPVATIHAADVVPVDLRRRRAIEEWAHRFAQAAVEIVGGDRPASQLVRWTATDVMADLRRRAQLVALAGGHQPGLARVQPVRPRVRSVHSCFVDDGVVECSVHVAYGERSRALALRFERRAQRWICTAADFA